MVLLLLPLVPTRAQLRRRRAQLQAVLQQIAAVLRGPHDRLPRLRQNVLDVRLGHRQLGRDSVEYLGFLSVLEPQLVQVVAQRVVPHARPTAPRLLTDGEMHGVHSAHGGLQTLGGVGHGVVEAAVHDQRAVGLRDAVVVVRQDALHGHAAPVPADVRGVPAVVLAELRRHLRVDDAAVVGYRWLQNDESALQRTIHQLIN